jgi:hypothetical protein
MEALRERQEPMKRARDDRRSIRSEYRDFSADVDVGSGVRPARNSVEDRTNAEVMMPDGVPDAEIGRRFGHLPDPIEQGVGNFSHDIARDGVIIHRRMREARAPWEEKSALPSALRKARGAPPKVTSGDRAKAVRAAVASACIEGVAVTPETQAVFEEYAAEVLDGDEMMERILRMYGPGA